MLGFKTTTATMALQGWESGGGSAGSSTGSGTYGPHTPQDPEGRIAGAQQQIFALLRSYPGAQQISDFQWATPGGQVIEIRRGDDGAAFMHEYGVEQSKSILKGIPGGAGSGSGGSGGGSTARLASDDPRYWANLDREFQLELAKFGIDAQNIGLDSEASRMQALTTLIANRNNTATDVAGVAASVAKTIAEFAGNPRDAVSELLYRNQVGGSTPFGDMTSKNFGEYGKALAAKAENIFQPVRADLDRARTYRDSIPPVEFFGPEIRQQLGLPPTPGAALVGGGGSMTSQPAPLAAGGYTPEQLAALGQLARVGDVRAEVGDAEALKGFQQLQAGAPPPLDISAGMQLPGVTQTANPRYKKAGTAPRFAEGGKLDFTGIFDGRSRDGFSPSSSEGGLNVNIHERAVIVGESGQIYGTLGERRTDGSVRAEQLQIKPLKSEVDKDKKLEEANRAKVETQKKTLAAFAGGGTATATPDDFMQQLAQLLGGQGGAGGGTGTFNSPLPSPRLLAGAPANALMEDDDLRAYTESGFSALGVSPNNLWNTVKKFTPSTMVNNAPRVSWGG